MDGWIMDMMDRCKRTRSQFIYFVSALLLLLDVVAKALVVAVALAWHQPYLSIRYPTTLHVLATGSL